MTAVSGEDLLNQELWERSRHGERGDTSLQRVSGGSGSKVDPIPWSGRLEGKAAEAKKAFEHPMEAVNLPYSLKAPRMLMF